MSFITQLLSTGLNNIRQNLLVPVTDNFVSIRNAAKKSGTTSKNRSGNKRKPKHRGWKRSDGQFVTSGTILATQRTTRFHPGLNCGWGKNGTLYAMEPGKVMITCEIIKPKWEHRWIQRHYSGRENDVIYKKHFNVIPEKQHNRFALIDAV